MEKGQRVRLVIEDISKEGQGIGKTDGFAVFVRGAVVGDTVEAEMTKVKKNYGFAETLKITEPSPFRQKAFCPYYEQCGGCIYQEMSYESQLELKRKQTADKLMRIGGIKSPDVTQTIGMEEPFYYRNKASMPVSTGGLITEKGGIVKPVHEPQIGFYKAKSHEVVDCHACALQAEPAAAAAEALRRFMKEDNITSYDRRWGKGLMRHMIVRTAFGTGQVMVILVINGKGIPNAAKLVEMLSDAIFDIPVHEEGPMANTEFTLQSVILNINRKNTSEILGDECITLAGTPTITEQVGELKFEISPLSFYQVNSEQMKKLYDKILEFAELKGDETVLDLYCGVGTIGLFCADYMRKKGGNGQVIGIESVKQAVIDANRNAVINGIVNARYICGRAEEELPEIMAVDADGKKDEESGSGMELSIERADIVILDPPRSGCDSRLLEAAASASPEKIIYVSCDAATMARDIKLLGEKGYELAKAVPVDMFPWTGSCETVALLTREKSVKSYAYVNISPSELGMGGKVKKPTYKQIKEYVLKTHGLKVSSLYIANLKDELGLDKQFSYEEAEMSAEKRPKCPPEKREAILDAFRHFGMID